MNDTKDHLLPVFIIGGFLGAGKTTLFNRLLQEGFNDKKVAIIVNDFGSVAVDASLIESTDEEMLVLRNGCVCCSLSGDLAQGLHRLLDSGSFEWIIMETSGVTELTSLRGLLQRTDLSKRLRLDRIVVVVDAVHFLKLQNVVNVVPEQVTQADVILLNRIDLVSQEETEQLIEALSLLNKQAPILKTTFCQVDLSHLEPAKNNQFEKTSAFSTAPDSWFTCRLVFSSPVSEEDLRNYLRLLPENIFRLKGFVTTEAGDILHVERVGTILTIKSWGDSVPENARDVLVAIGREELKTDLETIFSHQTAIKILEDAPPHTHS